MIDSVNLLGLLQFTAAAGIFVRMERRFTTIETILKECPYCHRDGRRSTDKK